MLSIYRQSFVAFASTGSHCLYRSVPATQTALAKCQELVGGIQTQASLPSANSRPFGSTTACLASPNDNSVVKVGSSAPFIPPAVKKLINVLMRCGEKEKAQAIVFRTTHALYNMSRARNPRPELKQRHKAFVPKEYA